MRVSGAILRSRAIFIRSRGDEAWDQVMAAVGPETRQTCTEGFLETRWYPYAVLVDLSSTADRVLGTGDMTLCEEMGRFSCEMTLTTVHRLLLKFGNLGHLVERAATAWRAQFDAGEVIVHEKMKDRYVFEVRSVPEPHRAHCAAITGWMVRAAELSGEDDLEHSEDCRALGDDRCMWTFERRKGFPGR